MSNLGLVGVEGILKSDEGTILYAFYKFIGIINNNQVKVEVATKGSNCALVMVSKILNCTRIES